MDKRIEMRVTGSHLWKDGSLAGVQHECNAALLRMAFDSRWAGLAKQVTFWNALGTGPVVRHLTADLLEDPLAAEQVYLCPIPGEAMAYPGQLTLVIEGYGQDKLLRSLACALEVLAAPRADAAAQPQDPTPSQAQQLQVQLDQVLGDLQDWGSRAVHQPVIGENGRWLVWSVEDRAYQDTGIPAAGPRGEQGPAGDTGPAGPQGPKGDTGPRGEPGRGLTITGQYAALSDVPAPQEGENYYIGAAAPYDLYTRTADGWINGGKLQGAKGDKGDQGEPGPQGIQGEQGPRGETGPAGPQGPAGADGKDGVQGPKGDTGPAGPQGPAGADGKDGAQGPKGDTGPAGPAGPVGADGAAGQAGADGQSAYAAAQAGGYTGTQTDFYADLGAMDGLAAWFAQL